MATTEVGNMVASSATVADAKSDDSLYDGYAASGYEAKGAYTAYEGPRALALPPPSAPVAESKAAAPVTRRQAIMDRIVPAATHDQRGQSLRWAGDAIESGNLHTKAKADKYIGEESTLGWRAPLYGQDMKSAFAERDFSTTRYATPAEQEQNRVRLDAKGGTLADAKGQALDGRIGFAMSGAGALHTFREFTDDRVVQNGQEHAFNAVPGYEGTRMQPNNRATAAPFLRGELAYRGTHHTTPLAGAPVAGAGFLQAEQGAIAGITDESGHYTPEAEYTYQAVRSLHEQGARMQRPGQATYQGEDGETHVEQGHRSAQVTLTGYDEMRGAGKQFIRDHNAKVSDPAQRMAAGPLTLPYQAFEQSRGNERQMRLKATAMEQIRARGQTPAHTPRAPAADSKAAEPGLYTLSNTGGASSYTSNYTLYADAPGSQFDD